MARPDWQQSCVWTSCTYLTCMLEWSGVDWAYVHLFLSHVRKKSNGYFGWIRSNQEDKNHIRKLGWIFIKARVCDCAGMDPACLKKHSQLVLPTCYAFISCYQSVKPSVLTKWNIHPYSNGPKWSVHPILMCPRKGLCGYRDGRITGAMIGGCKLRNRAGHWWGWRLFNCTAILMVRNT